MQTKPSPLPLLQIIVGVITVIICQLAKMPIVPSIALGALASLFSIPVQILCEVIFGLSISQWLNPLSWVPRRGATLFKVSAQWGASSSTDDSLVLKLWVRNGKVIGPCCNPFIGAQQTRSFTSREELNTWAEAPQ